jgi:hypothetical protein
VTAKSRFTNVIAPGEALKTSPLHGNRQNMPISQEYSTQTCTLPDDALWILTVNETSSQSVHLLFPDQEEMTFERRHLLLALFTIIAVHHLDGKRVAVRASHVDSYGSESERGERVLRYRELTSSRNNLLAAEPLVCCANLKRRREAQESNGGTASSGSTAGSASNSTFAITGGVILMLVLAAILLYMGILDLSEILPFVEMAGNDCGGEAGDDDGYAVQYDENDDY